MKFKFKPNFIFEHNGSMTKCDAKGEIELKDEGAIKKAKHIQAQFEKKKKEAQKKPQKKIEESKDGNL